MSAFLTLLFTLTPLILLLEPPLLYLMCILAVTLDHILKCQLRAADLFTFFMFLHYTHPHNVLCVI